MEETFASLLHYFSDKGIALHENNSTKLKKKSILNSYLDIRQQENRHWMETKEAIAIVIVAFYLEAFTEPHHREEENQAEHNNCMEFRRLR